LKAFYNLLYRPFYKEFYLLKEERAHALTRSYQDMPPAFPNSWFKLCDDFDVTTDTDFIVFAFNHQFTVSRRPGADNKADESNKNFDSDSEVRIVDENGKEWPAQECNHGIFVWHHSEDEPPNWHIPLIQEDMKNWNYGGRSIHEIVCHVQEIPENGADTAHLDYLHSPLIVDGIPASKHAWNATWEPYPAPDSHLVAICIRTHVEIAGFQLPFTHVVTNITQVGPGIVQLVFPTRVGTIVVQETITPIHANLQRARHCVWAEKKVPFFMAKVIMQSLCIQFERDFSVWTHKRWLRSPMTVREDGPILKYRRWMKQFFSGNGGQLCRDYRGREIMIEYESKPKRKQSQADQDQKILTNPTMIS
jgi:hypothetical protein